VRHVLVLTDAANLSSYADDDRGKHQGRGYEGVRRYDAAGRTLWLAAGDTWRARPYLPMTFFLLLGRLMARQGSPFAKAGWFFLATDRTYVDVAALLARVALLDPSTKGYYGRMANTTHKESFGFKDYIDIDTGVLLSAPLLARAVDPDECKDQKGGGGTFDMFDAKLGNCVFYLGARPAQLDGWGRDAYSVGYTDGKAPSPCGSDRRADSDVVTYGRVGPRAMCELAVCTGLLSEERAQQLIRSVEGAQYPIEPHQVTVHVMARESNLREIVNTCEDTWARGLPRVYYHTDGPAAREAYAISDGRWGISANLVQPTQGQNEQGLSSEDHELSLEEEDDAIARGTFQQHPSRQKRRRHDPGVRHRIASLELPERPDGGGSHWRISHDKGLEWNAWLRAKMKAIFEWSVQAHWSELQESQWFVYVDDDTYLLWAQTLELLRRYDPSVPFYFGRPLQEEGFPTFVGGGAGIVLSRAAALEILARCDSGDCEPRDSKWEVRTHQGGDSWLGDCAETSGVPTDMEFGFYPQPPVANLFHFFRDAVAFHGVTDHREMHASLAASTAAWAERRGGGDGATGAQPGTPEVRLDPRCVPVFLDHHYSCLPHFVIGGVPKAGTTSLYKYLLQHPEVPPAGNLELRRLGEVDES